MFLLMLLFLLSMLIKLMFCNFYFLFFIFSLDLSLIHSFNNESINKIRKHGNSETWYDDLVLYLTLLYFLVMTNFNDFTFVNELGKYF